MIEDLSLRLETARDALVYDPEKSVLLCKKKSSMKTVWAKKISDITSIDSVLEDERRYYISCFNGEHLGRYIALRKTDGVSDWSIPGRSFFHVIFGGYIYIIFIDEKGRYFLIKVDADTGGKNWHREVASDLCEYSFASSRIILKYSSGSAEILSPATGIPI